MPIFGVEMPEKITGFEGNHHGVIRCTAGSVIWESTVKLQTIGESLD
jgi:hypothetical protein